MQYVSMAIIGLITGIVARFVYPGAVHMGWISSIVLGILGSYLAGFIGGMIHKKEGGGFHPAGFVYSVLGALVLIFVARNVLHLV
jgi:uncharacterized membrane protein YeaQ/YmgE (transglycosylase-associated protein family)